MLCQPKSPELPTAEATWLRARRAAGLPERAGLPLRSRWRNGSRFSAHEWNAWSPPEPIVWLKKMDEPRACVAYLRIWKSASEAVIATLDAAAKNSDGRLRAQRRRPQPSQEKGRNLSAASAAAFSARFVNPTRAMSWASVSWYNTSPRASVGRSVSVSSAPAATKKVGAVASIARSREARCKFCRGRHGSSFQAAAFRRGRSFGAMAANARPYDLQIKVPRHHPRLGIAHGPHTPHAARRHATKHSAHLPTHAAQLMAIGDTMVGKTSLVMRYADDDFNENVLATIGIDFKIKVRRRPRIRSWWRPRLPRPQPAAQRPPAPQNVELDGKKIKLQIWDTAGQERFRTITQAYYRGAMGILLIYDVTNANTWKNVRNWVRNIADNAPQTVNKILIGNKADMKPEMRQVSTAQGQSLADEYGMKFFETSARTGVNVAEAFLTLATDVKDRLLAGGGEPAPSGGINVAQAPEPTGRKSGCC